MRSTCFPGRDKGQYAWHYVIVERALLAVFKQVEPRFRFGVFPAPVAMAAVVMTLCSKGRADFTQCKLGFVCVWLQALIVIHAFLQRVLSNHFRCVQVGV